MATTKETLWNSGEDESVEVNQRALIDKVLARYSGEFTVFRELLQNSDDALSNAVEIRFETKRYTDGNNPSEDQTPPLLDECLPDLKTALVHRWTLKNNGTPFRDEDWNRLKKIAEGNPDEEKIGAFGVGFYSLFSVTEGPFVMSGGKWMGFYWKDKKDQLSARRGSLPNQIEDPWTTFEMDLREPAPIPVAFEFTRFLASSITLMAHLREVSVYFDDKRLVHLTKDAATPKQLAIPHGLSPTSPMGFMNVKGLKSTSLHVTAEVMNWIYSTVIEKPRRALITKQIEPGTVNEAEYLEVARSRVVLAIFTAEVEANLSQKLSAELHRSMKKNPPRALKYDLIYTGKSEYDASKREDDTRPKAMGSIFQGLRADLDGSGSARVFIGHATAQTTGLGGHMATRFIPTVERESIDLVDSNVSVWNKELLYVGGFLTRAIYELEMQDIKTQWDASVALRKLGESLDPELCKTLYDRARHNLQFFTFRTSTPSPLVSSEMRSAFFNCGKPFSIVSSTGIKSALDVRMPDPTFCAFLPELPVFPEELLDDSKLVVAALQERGMLRDITFTDVLKGLQERPLSEKEMTACLRWWINTYQQDSTGIDENKGVFLGAAVLIVGSSDDSSRWKIPLEGIRTFLNPQNVIVPTDGPFPNHLLPINVNRELDSAQLQESLQWRELTILEWVQYIVDPAVYTRKSKFNIVKSPVWAKRVLQALGKCWPTLPEVTRTTIIGLLDKLSCIPTSAGMKTPNEAYFSSADIFHDLPTVDHPSGLQIKGSLEEMLVDLGVRKHVDLQIILDRLVKTGDWTTTDLINYLVSAKHTLKPAEIEQLRDSPVFPKEATIKQNKNVDGTPEKVLKFKASDLYEPSDMFRRIGLPIIDWRGKDGRHKWSPSSEEAKFLFNLGLRRHPPTKVILGIAAEGVEQQRTAALNYFLDNYGRKYMDYAAATHANIAFVPAVDRGKKKFVKPLEVFSDPDWQSFGFPLLDPDLRRDAVNILQIKEHPPTDQLVRRLEESPPTTESQAREWFGILSRRIRDFQRPELVKLSAMCIVPIYDDSSKSTGPRLLSPSQCYFKSKSNHPLYSKLFAFVDFGTSANSFLNACGAKGEPSVEDIVTVLLKDPRKFFQLAGGQDNYLVELRKIAINFQSLSSTSSVKLKEARILLGSRRRRKGSGKVADYVGGDKGDQDMEYDLLASNQVAVVDDMITYQQFGGAIFCAPQETILEDFYQFLGCKRLSGLIREELRGTKESTSSITAHEMLSLLLERLPFFVEHNHKATEVTMWLNKRGNFIIKTFEKVTVTRSIDFAGGKSTIVIEPSAAARKGSEVGLELWLANNAQVDMYDVAASLCRLLFKTRKPNDALLLATILSSDLLTLQKRGYPVDHLLDPEWQKAKKEGSVNALAKRADKTPFALPPSMLPNLRRTMSRPGWMSALRYVVPRPSLMPLPSGEPFEPSFSMDDPEVPVTGFEPPLIIPISSIDVVSPASSIGIAIGACKEEKSDLIPGLPRLQRVKGDISDYYCDISGNVGDLVRLHEVEEVGFYCSKDIPDPTKLLEAKKNLITRFIGVMMPILDLYQLPLIKVHMFYDLDGSTITFNRSGSIFVSLRHYEEWHDDQVRNGDLAGAYISWYFTLAHGIAHNLDESHNAKHEFCFSLICQKHITGHSKLFE